MKKTILLFTIVISFTNAYAEILGRVNLFCKNESNSEVCREVVENAMIDLGCSVVPEKTECGSTTGHKSYCTVFSNNCNHVTEQLFNPRGKCRGGAKRITIPTSTGITNINGGKQRVCID
jgi:hypothetical protein